MMGGFGIVGLLVPILLVVLAVWAISRMFPDWQDHVNPQRREDPAEETLRQRFARGDIDAEEYGQSLEILQSGRVSERSGANSA
jgi:putative membrane protein